MQSWVHVLEWRATAHPDVLALRDDRGTRLTYGELLPLVERRSGGWAERGVRPGDVVAVVGRNSADFFVQIFALMRAGAVPALVNWRLARGEVADLVALFEPVAVVADAEFGPLIEAAVPELDLRVSIDGAAGWTSATALDAPPPPRPYAQLRSDAMMALVHSSGTTGRPKAIPLVHGSLIRAVSAAAIEIGDQVAGSRHLQLMPLFHLGGLGQALQCVLTAGTLTVQATFDAHSVVDAIETDRIEFFTAGPSLIDMLVAEVRARARAPDLSSLREIQYGTAPITPRSLTDALTVLKCRLRQIYGNTECQSMISLLAPADHHGAHPHLDTAGQVAFGWEVKVVGPAGEQVASGEPGELLIRGDSLFPGYWRDPDASAAAFTSDGWFRTGDIVTLSAERYLSVLDRAKDMVITGGENVYPAEVEAVLAAHPDVADAAVIGVPDARWGEIVHAVIVPAHLPHASAAELIAWSRARLAHFKCPRSVEFTGSLPRTATGKVLKRELRAAHGCGGFPPADVSRAAGVVT